VGLLQAAIRYSFNGPICASTPSIRVSSNKSLSQQARRIRVRVPGACSVADFNGVALRGTRRWQGTGAEMPVCPLNEKRSREAARRSCPDFQNLRPPVARTEEWKSGPVHNAIPPPTVVDSQRLGACQRVVQRQGWCHYPLRALPHGRKMGTIPDHADLQSSPKLFDQMSNG
jgi:hypothetical protein